MKTSQNSDLSSFRLWFSPEDKCTERAWVRGAFSECIILLEVGFSRCHCYHQHCTEGSLINGPLGISGRFGFLDSQAADGGCYCHHHGVFSIQHHHLTDRLDQRSANFFCKGPAS